MEQAIELILWVLAFLILFYGIIVIPVALLIKYYLHR